MNLKQYLIDNDISQDEFAQKVGVTQPMVSHIINGRHKLRGFTAIFWAEMTNWQVTPHELNPQDFPNADDGMPKK